MPKGVGLINIAKQKSYSVMDPLNHLICFGFAYLPFLYQRYVAASLVSEMVPMHPTAEGIASFLSQNVEKL